MGAVSIQSLLSRSAELDSDSPRLDLELLLGHVLQRDRVYLRTWPEHTLNSEQLAQFETLWSRRLHGEPVAYLVGYQAFWSLQLRLNGDTLIPRPETETLVQEALARCPQGALRVLDLGTGSGAIALALASERPSWQVDAVDAVPGCVEMAQGNADALGLHRVNIWRSDWYSEVRHSYHLIVSNPPYIDAGDPHLQQGDLRYEPQRALVARGQGLAAIEQIIAGAWGKLEAGGYLMLEHGWQQGGACERLLAAAGLVDIHCVQDLAGRDRVSLARKPPAGSKSLAC